MISLIKVHGSQIVFQLNATIVWWQHPPQVIAKVETDGEGSEYHFWLDIFLIQWSIRNNMRIISRNNKHL